MNAYRFWLVSALLVLVSACGGGGDCSGVSALFGSATGAACKHNQDAPVGIDGAISGVAAGGAPIIGNVEITDSLGQQRGAPILADGRYSVDLKGMTGPFILKASGEVGGTSVTYYSAGLTSDVGGIINITPFTDLIVSSLTATIAEKFFSKPSNVAQIPALVTHANLQAAQTALYQKLLPVLQQMGVASGIDLLRTVFNADHTKLDAVLDLVRVETDSVRNMVTLRNLVSNSVLDEIDLQRPLEGTPIAAEKISDLPAAAQDLQLVLQSIRNFTLLFSTRIPTPAQLAASGLFDISTEFMMGGQDFEQFADEITSDPSMIGMQLTHVSINFIESGRKAAVNAMFKPKDKTAKENVDLVYVKKDGRWLLQGDRRIAEMTVFSEALYQQNTNRFSSGISFGIDPFAYNNGRLTPKRVVAADVTGPGLVSILPMEQSTYDTWLSMGSLNQGNVARECTPANSWPCLNITEISDNSTYRIVLKDVAGQPMNGEGDVVKLSRAPLPTASLKKTMFALIDSYTIDGQTPTSASFSPNKSLRVNFNVPVELQLDAFQIKAWGDNGKSYFKIQKWLQDPKTTSTLVGWELPENDVVVRNLHFRLSSRDVLGRKFVTEHWVQIN